VPVVNTSATTATLISIRLRTKDIAEFTFSTLEPITWRPGQHVILNFHHELYKGYSHMNDANPGSLNDDYVRSYTISSAPSKDKPNRFCITVRRATTVSRWLHQLKESMAVRKDLTIPMQGIGGDFSCFTKEGKVRNNKMVWVVGGVGITPFLSMMDGLNESDDQVDIVGLVALRTEDEIALIRPWLAVKKNINLTIKVFLSRASHFAASSDGIDVKTNRITKEDLANVEDIQTRDVYVCGPKEVMALITKWSEELGLGPERLYKEEFLY